MLWGDTHLHTSNSFDARALGATLDAEGAFRFARGEEVVSSTGQAVRLARPLDFLVVTDHSDLMGSIDQLIKGNEIFTAIPVLNSAREKLLAGGPDVGNSHRNVLYRDSAKRARQLLPFTVAQSIYPQDLWGWMQRYEDLTGGQVLALAHNGNISNGTMFPVETNPDTGNPIDADYVEQRIRWEPLYEVTQVKGDGEAHPYLSPEDEFADFESWDRGNTSLEEPKKPEMLQYE